MRILFIANCGSLFGANRSMLEMAIALRKLGQELFFFFPKGVMSKERYLLKKYLNDNDFVYVFLEYVSSVHDIKEKGIEERALRNTVNRMCLTRMKDYVEKWKIDIIHTNSLTHLVGAILSRQTRKPHIWHIREALKEDYNLLYDSRLQYRCALRNAEQVICISNYVRKIHRDMLTQSNVLILKDGFDIKKYVLHKAYQTKRAVYNLMICGYIQEGKGQLDAVRAVDHLVHDYGLKNIYLRIVGGNSGVYCEKIKRYIIEKHLQDYVSILPFQEDLKELRRDTDIALMCSRNEALGRVTVESMLSENLVIGADAAGTKEIIRDGINGYLYKTGNIHALCDKIYNAIQHWDKQERIIRNAQKYAIQNYDSDRYVEKILAIYHKVTN